MTEERVFLPIPGEPLQIHGRLIGRERASRDVLFVFVHGLGDQMNYWLLVSCARMLEERGFSSFRFNSHGEGPDERSSRDYSISTQAADLDLVVAHFKQSDRFAEPPWIVAVGHCMGALAVLSSSQTFDAAILISHGEVASGGALGEVKSAALHIVDWHYSLVVGEQMVHEYEAFDAEAAFRSFDVPTFMVAGYGELDRLHGRHQLESIPHQDKRIIELDHADHWFSTQESTASLVDVFSLVANYVRNTSSFHDRLSMDDIENYWLDLLRLIACRAMDVGGYLDATTAMNSVIAAAFERRMGLWNRLRDTTVESTTSNAASRQDVTRARLRRGLEDLGEASKAVALDELPTLWAHEVLREGGIAQLACEIDHSKLTVDLTARSLSASGVEN